MGIVTAPRCTTRACPVVYRAGHDRPCPIHADNDGDTLAARLAAFADLAAPPGNQAAGSQDQAPGQDNYRE